MKVVIPVLLLLVAVAIAGTAAWFYLAWSFRGGGSDVPMEQRPLPPFTRIVVEGFADVMLVQGSVEAVSVESPGKLPARLRADVSDGTLTISHDPSRRWWSGFFGAGGRPARITITFRELEALGATGTVKVRSEGIKAERFRVTASGATSLKIAALYTKELTVSGSGAMRIEIAGKATEQRVSISGAGDYRAAELASEDARVSVSGAGKVVVQAEKTLRIGLSGAGLVEYLGNPKVTHSISGAGRVRRRDAGENTYIVAYDPSAPVSPPSGR
jgi:hypothetical protein